jgi:SAM-dependent methyltransferase
VKPLTTPTNQPDKISQANSCLVCNVDSIHTFFSVSQVPVLTNVLWNSRSEALSAGRGDIQLAFCKTCGHVFNRAFDPASMQYSATYENSLHFSPRFQSYAEALAQDLVKRYDLQGKKIVEIGSGKGDFLNLLCLAGQNHGVGFDPSYDGIGSPFQNIRFVQAYFSEQHAGEQADFICSRHTLEHIPAPNDFVQMLKRAVSQRPETVIFIEVPNLRFTLDELAIWDLINEHVSYFNASSISRLFAQNGFQVHRVEETYEGQFLTLEATIYVTPPQRQHADMLPSAPQSLAASVEVFSQRFQEKTALWQHRLNKIQSRGEKTVLWGAGSKGISFLNFLNVKDEVPYVVDINPRKRGMFISGSGQEIVPPEFLRDYRPDSVIIMNPIYRTEIEHNLADMGLQAEILVA